MKKDLFQTLYWQDNTLFLLNQLLLPNAEKYHACKTSFEAAEAIRTMIVRGAPAIGVAAAYGAALAGHEIAAKNPDEFLRRFDGLLEPLRASRPTAVNLFWAVDRMRAACLATLGQKPFDLKRVQEALSAEAQKIHAEDLAANRQIGEHGHVLIPNGAKILTHCNAGALATSGFGTALGVIYAAQARGKELEVYADETRPYLQGARLTAWELQRHGIPVTLICDNMAGHLMKTLGFDLVIVGADRIAANGDVANKIGTYSLALLAQAHQIPFYVAAPTSTIDLKLADGSQIPIEERAAEEVTQMHGHSLAPMGTQVRNPAFDITPHHLISGIITQRGILKRPFAPGLKAHVNQGVL